MIHLITKTSVPNQAFYSVLVNRSFLLLVDKAVVIMLGKGVVQFLCFSLQSFVLASAQAVPFCRPQTSVPPVGAPDIYLQHGFKWWAGEW